MKRLFIGILILIILAGVGISLLQNQKKTNMQPSEVSLTTPSPTSPLSPTPSPVTTDLGRGGSSYMDPKGFFSILYPNDYTLDTQDPQHIRIYKRGETQRPQSEMSNGALLVFESVTLEGKSLKTWVDTRINEATTDGTSEVVEKPKQITQNGYTGFSYTLRGLGTSQNIVLQKNDTSSYAVLISYDIEDPTNKGYQKEVDAILASLKLLK